jgi:biotin carboxyl carrier protein
MMFDSKNDIFELMEKFDKSALSELELSSGEFRVKFSKNSKLSGNPGNYENYSVEEYKVPDNLKTIKAPLVGTFYSSASPESGAYVTVGDKVTVGMVVCIIEAMKTMNEIESDADGIVAEILVKNAQPVEYGQPLFKLK